MIKIRDLTYRYHGSSCAALRSIDLTIEAREFVVVTGASGSGKSTLGLAIAAVLFNQFEGQASGQVFVNGMDMRTTPIFKAADCVGLVQQNPEAQFCTLTVLDEMAFGLENRCLPPEEISERMNWALQVVSASHLIDRELAMLSGGEKQKVAIASVMAARPQVLILDEPTSNLDPSATAEILRVIDDLRRSAGLTVIIIEHKLDELAGYHARRIDLKDGQLVYDGRLERGRRLWQFDGRIGVRFIAKTSVEPIVRVRDLQVSYGEEPALQEISLDLAVGEFVAVMGDNGSGKSTFLEALLGLVRPTHGSVQVFGCDTRQTPVSDLARRTAFIFQNPDHQLFASSVWDEAVLAAVNFGKFDARVLEQTHQLLERCGLHHRQQDHPYRLSYGEKRRLNLVSVLNYGPDLILLDEILIGQDVENAHFLLDFLAEHVSQGATVVMVNHSPIVTAGYAHRLLFFQQGRVTIDAPIPEAFRQLESMDLGHYCVSQEDMNEMHMGARA